MRAAPRRWLGGRRRSTRRGRRGPARRQRAARGTCACLTAVEADPAGGRTRIAWAPGPGVHARRVRRAAGPGGSRRRAPQAALRVRPQRGAVERDERGVPPGLHRRHRARRAAGATGRSSRAVNAPDGITVDVDGVAPRHRRRLVGRPRARDGGRDWRVYRVVTARGAVAVGVRRLGPHHPARARRAERHGLRHSRATSPSMPRRSPSTSSRCPTCRRSTDATFWIDGDATSMAAGRGILLVGTRRAAPRAAEELRDRGGGSATGARTAPDGDRRAGRGRSTGRTAVVFGNVAQATHGETVTQLLGSGDARVPFAAVGLAQAPLTFVPRRHPARHGVHARGAGRRRRAGAEVPTTAIAGPRDRVFVTRDEPDGGLSVVFGDGARGARPPTGSTTCARATARASGAAGNVAAGRAGACRSTGRSGSRASPTRGRRRAASIPRSRRSARRSIPIPVRTLGRAVSLLDYADFALAFTGHRRGRGDRAAAARRRRCGRAVGGGCRGPPPAATSLERLDDELARYGDPLVAAPRRAPCRPASFRLALKVDARRRTPRGRRCWPRSRRPCAPRTRLPPAASASPCTRRRSSAVAASVVGVVAVDLDLLYRAGRRRSQRRLVARARVVPGHDAARRRAARARAPTPSTCWRCVMTEPERRDRPPRASSTLLPAVYRMRDAETGGVLAELLASSATRSTCSPKSSTQLYDDQFIETARAVGGAVHRRPRRLPRAPRCRARRRLAARPRSRTPSPTGGARAPPRCSSSSRATSPAGRRASVEFFETPRDHAVHEPRPSAARSRRPTCATTRRSAWIAQQNGGVRRPRPHRATCAAIDAPAPGAARSVQHPRTSALFLWRTEAVPLERSPLVARRRSGGGSGSTRSAPTRRCSRCRGPRPRSRTSPSRSTCRCRSGGGGPATTPPPSTARRGGRARSILLERQIGGGEPGRRSPARRSASATSPTSRAEAAPGRTSRRRRGRDRPGAGPGLPRRRARRGRAAARHRSRTAWACRSARATPARCAPSRPQPRAVVSGGAGPAAARSTPSQGGGTVRIVDSERYAQRAHDHDRRRARPTAGRRRGAPRASPRARPLLVLVEARASPWSRARTVVLDGLLIAGGPVVLDEVGDAERRTS